MRTFTLFILFICLQSIAALAGSVKGTVTDAKGEPIPYASIYVKNSTYGVSADEKGKYFIELKPGSYTLVFNALGYAPVERAIQILGLEGIELSVQLEETSVQLQEVVVTKKQGNLGKEIMEKVRAKRGDYFDAVRNYQCHTYQKISIEKESSDKDKTDSTAKAGPDGKEATASKNKKKSNKSKTDKDSTTKITIGFQGQQQEKTNLIESVSTLYYDNPSHYNEDVLAYHDFADTKPGVDRSVAFGMELGEHQIVPYQYEGSDPYLLTFEPSECDFNFYRNVMPAPKVTGAGKPLLSPLANTASINYKYHLDGSFYENGKKIYKIHVEPIFKSDALFEGTLFIEDSTWAIRSLDLTVQPAAMTFFSQFRIIQNYDSVAPGVYVPVRREITYTINDADEHILGNLRVEHSDYQVNKPMPKKTFTAEVKHYENDAFDKDTSYWNATRPILLKETELKYISKTDSLRRIYTSDSYLDSLDSVYNHISFWSPTIFGIGHRNHYTGIRYYIIPLIQQVNPVGIGGYRHRLGGEFDKEFHNAMLLETRGQVDYGFANHDVKGKLGVGLTYIPLKFVRTFVEVGDFYSMLNTNASLSAIFSRSNYARTKSFSVAQRMEIVNGLFGELTVAFADEKPLTGLRLQGLADTVWGALNTPTDFREYIKTEIQLELKYEIGQQYVTKHGKKFIIGRDYPEVSFIYRKGVPGLFNSEVNFDYLQLGYMQFVRLGRMGTSWLFAQAGTFTNKSSLRVVEYKYFRGSDPFLMSDPLHTFQLLGPTLNATSGYFQVNYVHHFEGFPLNKVPLISKMKLGIAAGVGALSIPQENFNHFEMFAGLERAFRIRKELFRFGFYAVTSDNRLDGARITYKFGISAFDSYANKWSY